MKKTTFLILLLSVCFSALSIHAQSGRKRPDEPKQTTTKTDPAKPADDGVVNESRVNPEGETVEGDVIRVDTALVTVPVSVT